MKRTVNYLNELPDFVTKKAINSENMALVEDFMKRPDKIMQIDVTGRYSNSSSALSSWAGTVKKCGYKISVRFGQDSDRQYLFLIKNTDGTAPL